MKETRSNFNIINIYDIHISMISDLRSINILLTLKTCNKKQLCRKYTTHTHTAYI